MGHSSIVVSESYVKLASTGARKAHGKAFGGQALNLIPVSEMGAVLKQFRKISKSRA